MSVDWRKVGVGVCIVLARGEYLFKQCTLLYCSRLSQLFPHVLVWFVSRREKKREGIFHTVFQIAFWSLSSHTNIFFYVYFVEWFHSSAHCLQEEQSQGDGAASEAWRVHTGSH